MATADHDSGIRRRKEDLDKLFRIVLKHDGSELHLKAGQPPIIRVKNEARKTDMAKLKPEDIERLLLPLLNDGQRRLLDEKDGVELSYMVGQDEGRFRLLLFRKKGELSMVAERVNPNETTSLV